MNRARILIVDDEENIGRSLRMILEPKGYQVACCTSAAGFRAAARADLYLMDVRLPDGNGIDLLRQLRQGDSAAPVIMISGHGTIADAVAATRAGAFDFLEKPLARDKVLVAVKNAIEQASLRQENRRLHELLGESRMIGSSAAFEKLVEQATVTARSDARVMIIGESGTGKELLAAHIHASSPFSSGPFIKVNCAAIPSELIESELFGHEKGAFTGSTAARRGKFELADGGTLLLDEVGDLHPSAQAKLLRVLQEGEFHRVGGERPIRVAVRVLSATNRDLVRMAAQQRFREDLYYRLCVVPIRVPPLRERSEDIGPLAEYFLDEFCARNNFRPKTIDGSVIGALEQYRWPGNARELRNAIERMAILTPGERIGPDSVPVEIRFPDHDASLSTVQETRMAAEREVILRALEETGWNVSRAARALGMERTNLHKRMRALGIDRNRDRATRQPPGL